MKINNTTMNKRLAIVEKVQALEVLGDKLNKNLDKLTEVSPIKAFELEGLYATAAGVLTQLFSEKEYGLEEFLDRSIRLSKKINKRAKKAIKKYSK